MNMNIDELTKKIISKYPKLSPNKNWGERGLFYNPGNQFSLGAYVLTFKEKDGKNDSASDINREGVYRLNLKISKETYIALFGSIPKRPAAGKVIKTNHDFTKLDEVMPHPIYGWMTWICVLNPTFKTIEAMEKQNLFEEAYQAAVANINKKLSTLKSSLVD